MKRAIGFAFSVGMALSTTAAVAEPVTSITQYGMTWTFDGEYESGQFASGDSWVVGPVRIESVTPAPAGGRNGSVVNPRGGRQGYDDRGGNYATDDNVTFPYTLEVDESLVSSVSKPNGGDFQNVGCLQSQAVLTAVAEPQAATALRPSYAGTFKQYLDTTSIDWSLLPSLAPPASAPNGASLLEMADRPRIDHMNSWTIQHSCAEDNWNNGDGAHACYGREVSAFMSNAALYAMLDTPERDELVVSLVQHGIDNYGVLKAGGGWSPNGGHHNARKFPIVLAARLLDDCDLLRVSEEFDDTHFGEDGQTYLGTEGTALFGWDCGGGHGTYLQDGCSGGGAKDCRDPAGLVDGCPDYRNCCTTRYWVGQMLATLMVHARDVWNHEAYFGFVDRWMAGNVEGGGSAQGEFVDAMWTQYRDDLPSGTTSDRRCATQGDPDAGSGAADAGQGSSDAGTTDASNSSAGSGGQGGSDAGSADSGGSTAGGGASGAGGSPTGAGGRAADSGPESGPDSAAEGAGCGCRTPSSQHGADGVLALGAALLAAFRFRRRRGPGA